MEDSLWYKGFSYETLILKGYKETGTTTEISLSDVKELKNLVHYLESRIRTLSPDKNNEPKHFYSVYKPVDFKVHDLKINLFVTENYPAKPPYQYEAMDDIADMSFMLEIGKLDDTPFIIPMYFNSTYYPRSTSGQREQEKE